jgi:hypothetical protein
MGDGAPVGFVEWTGRLGDLHDIGGRRRVSLRSSSYVQLLFW